MPEGVWGYSLHDQFVCRALDIGTFTHRRSVTGFQIGRGDIMARLYDKPMEVRQKSGKLWMYDIWKVPAVPEGHRIIRVEYQLKREMIKQLQLDTVGDVLGALAGIWNYCTQEWLRVVDDPRKHHTQQSVEPWWKAVQGGFAMPPGANSLVRTKAVSHDQKILRDQIRGAVAALVGLTRQGDLIKGDEVLEADSHIRMVMAEVLADQLDDEVFTEKVKRTQAKKVRAAEKFKAVKGRRYPPAIAYYRPRILNPRPRGDHPDPTP